ncbi:hydrogenase [Candidatus Altiarchaeota archaeon]
MRAADKPKIAVYDLTDCEGCEVELINLKEELIDLSEEVDIVNWRLAADKASSGPFDVTLIEGTPVTEHEREQLRDLRKKSAVLIALGACACTGGIPAIIDDERDRMDFYKMIYPPSYVPQGTEAKPLDAYVKIDFYIHGCPVDKREIERILSDLLACKKPELRDEPVCMSCKINDNDCMLAKDKPCLGPIIRGGCNSFCITHGKSCVGCYGMIKDANFDRMVERLGEIMDPGDAELLLGMFLSESKEFKKKYDRK